MLPKSQELMLFTEMTLSSGRYSSGKFTAGSRVCVMTLLSACKLAELNDIQEGIGHPLSSRKVSVLFHEI